MIVPIGKPRKGKPHWRYYRALICDDAWEKQWVKIIDEYQREQAHDYKWWHRTDYFALATWLQPRLGNATVRFDPIYKAIAVDFDDDAARTLFILTWI